MLKKQKKIARESVSRQIKNHSGGRQTHEVVVAVKGFYVLHRFSNNELFVEPDLGVGTRARHKLVTELLGELEDLSVELTKTGVGATHLKGKNQIC